MNTIEIKQATISNLALLQDISKRTFSETFAAQNTAENMEKYLTEAFSYQALMAELSNANSAFYFATLDNNVIGYLKINVAEAQTELKNANNVEIERIYVLKEFHGQNIGQQLYQKAIQIAQQQNAEYVWLGVWEKNFRAISFYTKNGFIPFDKHIFRLGDDEQIDIMMKLKLTN